MADKIDLIYSEFEKIGLSDLQYYSIHDDEIILDGRFTLDQLKKMAEIWERHMPELSQT